MTTSSKTNMNEDLKKEFEKKFTLKFAGEPVGIIEDHKKIWQWIETAISKARLDAFKEIDPFDLVQQCKPDCTPVEHAYHQGTWDSHVRLEKILELLTQKK